MPSALEELQAYLLPKTLEHAVRNSAFYAEHLGEAWRRVEGPADLVLLPILEKPLAVQEQDRMRCGPAPTDFGSVSSGTTRVGSRAFRVERCPEEQQALADLYDMLDEVGGGQAAAPAEPGEPPLVLHILTPNHGLPADAAPPHTLRFAWSYSRNVCDMIEQALRSEIGGRRITVLRVSVSILKQLTVWFLDRGVSFDDFAVESMGTYAALVTPRWRRLVEETWGARVFDNYSLSEVKTPATECEVCGWYHFTEPPVIAEVLDPASGEPAAPVGHLVLTTLYPYVQRTPLIRYATGDLVEVGPRCAERQAESLRFVGRRHQTPQVVEGGATRYLLFPARLESIVDDYPDVARHLHPFERTEKVPPGRVGQPKLRADLREDGRVVEVTVGSAFDPRLFPSRATELRDELAGRLLAEHPALAVHVAAGTRRLDVTLRYAPRDDDWNEWFVKYLA